MRTEQFTPGPWHYATGEDGAVIYTGFTIAKIPIDGLDWQSNAHLIASAPELLAALKSLVDDFERIIGRPIEAEHEAKVAISKATGGAL